MKTVMTVGCFDLLHQGHLNLLKKARELGDYLIVGVPSDYLISIHPKKVVKNAQDSETRLRNVQSLKYVDLAFICEDEDGFAEMIRVIKPQVICRGDDKKDFTCDVAEEVGAEVVMIPYTKGISSTLIKEKL